MRDEKGYTFYSIDDDLVLRQAKGPGALQEHYTENGWQIWLNVERFYTTAEEIDEDRARELLARRKKRLAELKAAA